MSCRISLITPEQLYEWADLALNVDADKLTRNIIVAQDRFIKPILCKDLFDELINQVENNSLTNDFTLLLEKIQPVLAFRTYARFLNSANLDSTDKGLRTWREDNSDVITDKRLGELISQADQDSLTYENDLKVWLHANKTCFSPFYDDCGCSDTTTGQGFKITKVGQSARKVHNQDIVANNLLDNQTPNIIIN